MRKNTSFIGTETETPGSVGAKKSTVPPLSTELSACSNAAGAPVETITTSASRPSLDSRRRAGTSSVAEKATSAPRRLAAAMRYSTMSVAIILPAPRARAKLTCSNPARPLPKTSTL